MDEEELITRFRGYRSGDIVLSAGKGVGDLIIFFGRHTTFQHSAILVWLDKQEAQNGNIKVVPYFKDDDTVILSFLGLAEGRKMDIVENSKQKGMILYQPAELFKNAPIIYVRELNQQYITDEYVVKKLQKYIEYHHLKTQYAYGKFHIIVVGWLGYGGFGRHPTGILCSENVYYFLKFLCDYPDFKIDEVFVEYNEPFTKFTVPDHEEYKVPDALDYLYTPDFFESQHNTHPIFEKNEYKVVEKLTEREATVFHPYFITFAVLVIIILFLFFIINNYCESCRVTGFCIRPIQQDFIF